MNIEEKFNIIKRNTEEIISEDELKNVLKKKKPIVYWGTAPTGKPHVGYFFPMLKIADFLKAGFEVKILLADIHAALDNTPWDVLNKRYNYYSKVIPLMIEALGVSSKNLFFVKGSDFQLKPEYMFEILQMSSYASVRDTNRAASEVVKMGDNPALSGLIYPLMQALDEQYLMVDVQLGGTDQRKIMVLARELLPKLNYSPRVEVMHPLIPSLIGGKMSSSNEKGKVDLMDDEETVFKKIKGADCVVGDIDNGIISFLKYVIMVLKEDKKEKFVVERDKKYGGNLEYESYKEIEKDFIEKKLHPLDLKIAVAKEINNLLKPFRKNFSSLEKLSKEAY
jgi:tyrosyl-tRNA synthetase